MNAVIVHQRKLPGNTLKAVLIYDDFNAATRTKCVLERAARRAGKGMTCGVRPWRVDVLKQGGADDEEALADAAGADLIFLVLRSLRALPAWLMGWLDKWAGCRQVPDAALAFQFGDMTQVPTAVGRELDQFAKRHGVSLLTAAINRAEMIQRTSFTTCNSVKQPSVRRCRPSWLNQPSSKMPGGMTDINDPNSSSGGHCAGR